MYMCFQNVFDLYLNIYTFLIFQILERTSKTKAATGICLLAKEADRFYLAQKASLPRCAWTDAEVMDLRMLESRLV